MEEDLAEVFLVNFMYHLIEAKSSLENNLKKQEVKQENYVEKPFINLDEHKIEKKTPAPIQIKKATVINPQIIKKPIKNYKSERHPNYSITQSQISTTDKLNALMKDPYVNEIECLGTESPLVVQKSGISQKTQINLSIEEIYELIAEFSQKTRIPVINGKIKAALNNLIITAVLSETVGPRFIIQKKKPFTELIA